MKDIGGYIELEISAISEHYHHGALPINNARNGIVYAIRAYDIKEMWVPYYTCHVVWQAIEEASCKVRFYHIDRRLMPDRDFGTDDYVLYTNYYGVCGKNVRALARRYKNLIVDNAQAFYAPPVGLATVYSPRKFFGLPDGGYVYCSRNLPGTLEQDKESYKRFSHLLMRIEGGANFGYADFNKNDDSLIGEEIKLMSNLTTRLIKSIDYDRTRQQRMENFRYMDHHLKRDNLFQHDLSDDDVPMYYPFLTEKEQLRKHLIDNKIYIPLCWRNQESGIRNQESGIVLLRALFDEVYAPSDY